MRGRAHVAPLVALAACATSISSADASGSRWHPTGTERSLRPTAVNGPIDKRVAEYVGSVVLPDDARQRGTRWFYGHLAIRVRLRPHARPSNSFITLSSNDRATVQIELLVPGGHRPIRWRAFGLIDGSESGLATGRSFRISARNYLQFEGVRPGRNAVQVRLEEFGAPVIAAVEVLPSTAIAYGLPAPPNLSVRVRRGANHDDDDRAGSVAHAYVRNNGGRPAAGVSIQALTADGRRLVTNPSELPALSPGATRRVQIAVPRSHRGTIRVRASSRFSTAEDEVSAQVRTRGTAGDSETVYIVSGLAMTLGTSLLWCLRRRRRRKRPLGRARRAEAS